MGLTTAGADRMLKAVTGQAVDEASEVTVRLHTGIVPGAGNELTGGGYGRRVVRSPGTDFRRDGAARHRRLLFPEMQWFSTAGSTAETAQSVGLWHGSTLMWSLMMTIVPRTGEVKAAAGEIFTTIAQRSPSMLITRRAADLALRALAGEEIAAPAAMHLVLHDSSGPRPSSASRITGGGIAAFVIPATTPPFWTASGDAGDDAWNGYRRFSAGAVVWPGLTAATNTEPSRLALWAGDPAASGVLHAWRPITPTGSTGAGVAVRMSAGDFYLELSAIGSAAA